MVAVRWRGDSYGQEDAIDPGFGPNHALRDISL